MRDGRKANSVQVDSVLRAAVNQRPVSMQHGAFDEITVDARHDASRMPVYQLLYTRSREETLSLINAGIGGDPSAWNVKDLREAPAAGDFNLESALFPGGDGDEQGESELMPRQQLTYEKVQKLLGMDALQNNDLEHAQAQLKQALGDNNKLVK
jgi:hypothetical protein